jgi:hypothetical protein
MFKKLFSFLKNIFCKMFCNKKVNDVKYVINYTTYDNKICNINYSYYKPFGNTNVISNTYKNGIGEIAFDAPVTKISSYTFNKSANLKTITIPNTVIEIQPYAFNNEKIVAFYGMYASEDNKSLIINDTLVAVAFGGVKNYIVPNNIKCFNNVFNNIKNKNLSITLNDYCGRPYDFQYSYVQLVSNVENVPENSFRDNVFSKVTLGENTKSLGEYSFMRSTGIYVYDMPHYNQYFSNNCQIICKATIPPSLGNKYIFGKIEPGTDQYWEYDKFAYKTIIVPKKSQLSYSKQWSKYKPYMQYISIL